MTDTPDLITRREALARVGYLLGGTLSASTVAGVLAGCAPPRGAAAGAAWLPRTLSPRQAEMVLVMGEIIVPQTDTPGARAARVDQYVDAMLTGFYPAEERARFLAGLERADARARATFGRGFLESSPGEQLRLVRALNEQAFPAPRPQPPAGPTTGDPKTPGGEHVRPVVENEWDPADVGARAFFRALKELVLVGYYTSEAGATGELAVNPMGVWRPDIPYSEVARSWA